MFAQGIPLAAFETSDIAGDFARLRAKNVAFTKEPTPAGPVKIAINYPDARVGWAAVLLVPTSTARKYDITVIPSSPKKLFVTSPRYL